MLRGTVGQPAPRMQSSSSRLRRFKPELSPKPLYRDGVTPHGSDTLTTRRRAVQLPERVEVIVSEWMGFHLYHESMLDSVLV